jgi:UPF0755 protein
MKKAAIIAGVVVLALGISGAFSIRYFFQRLSERDLLRLAEKRSDISITIIEGKRREEIANQLEAAGITSAADFLKASSGDEGMLFPDTYRFFPNTSAADVVTKMKADFYNRMGNTVPTHDQLVLASIVEREASNDSERATIAAVYLNRLRIGMKLQSDPTVQYSKDSLALANDTLTNFWSPITQADYLSANSPFNTYLIDGLPPEPICNPGQASITAAMNPATIDPGYIFFYEKNGQLLLAKTLAQHNLQAGQ